ncbi:MAG: hypothetical protein ACKO0Z_07380 [Betaproteobacteria bacterium]
MTISFEYMAGLFDGEGTVTLMRHDGSPFRQAVVSMQLCDETLIREIQRSFGGIVTKRKGRKPGHSDSWTWKLSHGKALEFIKGVFPYLRLKSKVERASYIINGYDGVTKRNGKYNDEEKRNKLEFEEGFFLLTPTRMSPTFTASSFEELVIT